ncbi:L,D-transpeptidase family protein [Vibrio metschnikovii]|uniref:L,D-transpeptidase family protein n=1 Tax=Vibrio metschnikovii TaxID=28172 RepID=UPI001C2F2D07|nr:L,D-transpeptidase family protein [Vibrio metschnikovii]EKO3564652.1 L,D-transpeptidase family protein [Vibrio metschnikovii]EKO3769343.1 L,D-transpeptidase family protein [Vibrio metschnikovii]
MLRNGFLIGLLWLSGLASLQAAVYELPKEGSRLVGRMHYHEVQEGQTLAQIAGQYDVGFLALMAANKGVDPFLPQAGLVLTIPSQVILPEVEYQGIVVNLAELRLYYFPPNTQQVHIFPVGIGRIGRDTPEMTTQISQMRRNPTWTPPQSVRNEYLQRGIELPAVVPAGPDNPMGNYAMRLAYGSGEYLIHGTNKDFGIGMRVSAGCIRMDPKDIEWLFHQVDRGVKVRIIDEPIKVTLEPDRSVYLEAHEPLTRSDGSKKSLDLPVELTWWLSASHQSDARARAAIAAQNGFPVQVVAPSVSDDW